MSRSGGHQVEWWGRIGAILGVVAVTSSCAAQLAAGSGGLRGGGPLGGDGGPCITPMAEAAMHAQVDAFFKANVDIEHLLNSEARGCVPIFRFYPMAGTIGRDLLITNYVDLAAGSGLADWNCEQITYEGHTGHDVVIRTFDEQAIGVPIFAAMDGSVAVAVDGHPDMNTTWANQPANYVIVAHPGNIRTWYGHMKLGSVAVVQGQAVKAGQQLGLVGSSGSSTYPHLHFDTRFGTLRREPNFGPCQPDCALWANQTDLDREFNVYNFAFSRTDMASIAGPPWSMPRDNQMRMSDATIWFWIMAANLPAASTWKVEFFRPDGLLGFSTGTVPWGNTFYRWSWWNWGYNITAMHQIPGTWRLKLFINGVVQVDAPIEVVAMIDPMLNRPPEAIGAVFDPISPLPSHEVFCRVQTPLVVNDVDYDIVRYRYEWSVDGMLVRDFTGAALSDAIPAGTIESARVLRCRITPSDGSLDGPAVTVTYIPCPGDADDDDAVSFSDITAVLTFWDSAYGVGTGSGDGNRDGSVNFADITESLQYWGAACAQ